MYILILGFSVVIYCLAWVLEQKLHDPLEPEPVRSSLPLIGHIVGLTRESLFYFARASRTIPNDIVTIAVPGQKFYVIKSPGAVQAIQKRPDTISHDPLVIKFAGQACGTSPEGFKLVDRHFTGDLKEQKFGERFYSGMRNALKPGAELDRLSIEMGRAILERLESYNFEENQNAQLYDCMKATIGYATTRAIYGRKSPYNDPDILDAFWEFENGLPGVLFSPLPSITARKALKSRDKVAYAIEKYYKSGGLEADASEFARSRHRELTGIGLSELDTARFEVAGSFATFVNTSPVAFWMIRDVYGHPDLLREIREELDGIVAIKKRDGLAPTRTIDITTVTERCPLLFSTYREVVRRRSIGGLAKLVQEDTLIDVGGGDGGTQPLLLKKDAIVQVPCDVFHIDERFWGSDAAEFRPRRFMQGEAQKTASGKRPAESSYRAFGGGRTLCPGRFFAMTELLVVVAIVILRYDVEPATPDKSWPEPTSAKTNIATLVRCPDVDVPIRVKAREDVQQCEWLIRGAEQ